MFNADGNHCREWRGRHPSSCSPSMLYLSAMSGHGILVFGAVSAFGRNQIPTITELSELGSILCERLLISVNQLVGLVHHGGHLH
jgi:hypothetical protein